MRHLLNELDSCTNVFIDTETIGLHGMPVLLQWACDDGEIHLWDIWKRPIGDTLRIIEAMLEKCICGFNCSYDFFHICKCYTTFRLCPPEWIPEEHVNEIAAKEREAQDGPRLKPKSALDLFLYSRKTSFQSLMERSDIRIGRVPTVLAGPLALELEKRVQFASIYFSRRKKTDAPRWQVYETDDPNFSDVVLRFAASGSLKAIAEHVLGYETQHYTDVEPPEFPIELGYAPTAGAVSSADQNWKVWDGDKLLGHAWPALVQQTADHWATNEHARQYARDDVKYTRELYHYFDEPEPNDHDSVLACSVATVRWRGYPIDIEGVQAAYDRCTAELAEAPININKPAEVRAYVAECLDPIERLVIEQSTKKQVLETIARYQIEQEEACCDGGCVRCEYTGRLQPGPHPAAIRAETALRLKKLAKERELYGKLLIAGKLHPSYRVIGTLSGRMAGADQLNVQGINHRADIRSLFRIAWPGYQLAIGDFSSFEVVLADALYDDANLRADLTSGRKIHGLFGMSLFGKTYEEVMASVDTADDLYVKGKQGFFGSVLYGGDAGTLVRNLGVSPEAAENALKDFGQRYPGIARGREKVEQAFAPMTQPGGIGTPIYWKDPADYVETPLGYRRYFTLENQVCRALYELARNPPKEWSDEKVKVVRRDREQTAAGAVASALYGAAFSLQSSNVRAACNHQIQGAGAEITKHLQRNIDDLQPHGVHEWIVGPCNVHDEVVTPVHPDYVDQVVEVVRKTVQSYRDLVPLLAIDWCPDAKSWAEKKAGDVKIRAQEMPQEMSA